MSYSVKEVYLQEVALNGEETVRLRLRIEMKIIGASTDYFINTQTNTWFAWYANNNLMVLPAAAMFIIGIFIWIQRSYNTKLVDIS